MNSSLLMGEQRRDYVIVRVHGPIANGCAFLLVSTHRLSQMPYPVTLLSLLDLLNVGLVAT